MGQEEQLRLGTVTTLDEPVSETILRDVRQITDKLKVVLLPLGKDNDENVLKRLRECKLFIYVNIIVQCLVFTISCVRIQGIWVGLC